MGEKMVQRLVEEIVLAVSPLTDQYEIILVNDASPDHSWEEIVKACATNFHVKGINLSRNFGQHYAITAGLNHSKGEWVVVMDCDLQDNPREIPTLYHKALEGWDIVRARRMNKQFGFFKKLSSTVHHKVFDWLSGQKTDPAVGNYGIYNQKVISEFNKMPELSRSFGTLLNHLGFKIVDIDIPHAARADGISSYTLRKLLTLSFDISISNTNKPLKITVALGFMMSVMAFVMAIYDVVAKWMGLITVPGYTTTIFSVWFVGGLILFMMGILGLYIGKIFDQVKGRQLYVVRDRINLEADEKTA
jgi:dolichol-phosphate mannosyltransferase